jgi:hypothetical protein
MRSWDVIVVPADTLHTFHTLTEVRMKVVSALDAGQIFPRTTTTAHAASWRLSPGHVLES